MMKKAWPFLFLILVCLPVISALVKPGFYITHDGEFNLVRLMHFDSELRKGQFPVRWSFDLNFRYGSPIFTFFYPLMYYLGSLIHFFGFDFGSSLKILIAGATVGSVLLMYLWLSKRFSILAALVGSVLFLFVPYRLLVMYVTGSFGVLLSLLFAPLAFLAIDRRSPTLLSIAIFGLLTAHNVTALILLPVVILYALVAGKPRRDLVSGFFLGLGLASFFLLPALTETKYVFLSRGAVVDFRDHFPSLKQLIYSPWGYFYSNRGENDGMSFQVGIAQLVVVVLSVPLLVSRLWKKRLGENTKTAVLFALVFGISFLMMLPMSKIIWETVPMLPQIQFPWRLLAVGVVTIPFLTAAVVDSKLGRIMALLLIGLVIWNNRNYLRTWEMTRYSDESYRSRESLYYGSTDIAWETRPIWVEEKPAWLPVVINQFYYPSWKVTVDGVGVETKPTERFGLLSFEIKEGQHDVVIKQTKTTIQQLADGISLLSGLAIIYLVMGPVRKPSKRRKGQRPS